MIKFFSFATLFKILVLLPFFLLSCNDLKIQDIKCTNECPDSYVCVKGVCQDNPCQNNGVYNSQEEACECQEGYFSEYCENYEDNDSTIGPIMKILVDTQTESQYLFTTIKKNASSDLDVHLIYQDKNHQVIWSKTYTYLNDERPIEAVFGPSGHIYLLFETKSFINSIEQKEYSISKIKKETGEVLFTKNYPYQPVSIKYSHQYFYILGNKLGENQGMYLSKYDPQGELEQEKLLNSSASDILFSYVATAMIMDDTHLFILAYSNDSDNNLYQTLIAKLDFDLKLVNHTTQDHTLNNFGTDLKINKNKLYILSNQKISINSAYSFRSKLSIFNKELEEVQDPVIYDQKSTSAPFNLFFNQNSLYILGTQMHNILTNNLYLFKINPDIPFPETSFFLYEDEESSKIAKSIALTKEYLYIVGETQKKKEIIKHGFLLKLKRTGL